MGFDKSSLEHETEAQRIRHMADEAVDAVGFDKAEKVLAERIGADPSLTRYAIQATARAEVRMAMAVRRQRIAGAEETVDDKRADGSPKRYSDAVCRKVSEYAGKFLGWPMSNRKVLGEATLVEVREEAEMYEANAMGNARNGRFMRLLERRMLALKVKEGEPVKKLLTDDQLARLMAKAQKAE